MSFTKGKYQFVVATHTDHANIHNPIIFNSTSIDHMQKFRNFLGSSEAIRKINDKLCLENGLSIIEVPKQGPSHYGKWLNDKKPLSWQEKLRQTIDAVMAQKPADFDTFLKLMMKCQPHFRFPHNHRLKIPLFYGFILQICWCYRTQLFSFLLSDNCLL